MALIYLGIGTNLGDKQKNLSDAVLALSSEVGTVLCVSSFYISKPWGFDSENNFLNAVVGIKTGLSPHQLLEKCKELERKLGRKEKTTTNYTDRIIDIDILLYDNLVVSDMKLKIPHPLLVERDFVLLPLAEIAPDLVHPVLGKKMVELINRKTYKVKNAI
jgi:2-amino-4-hydroxy-6-hydroxymethyldihydropteridine diphosphokinase